MGTLLALSVKAPDRPAGLAASEDALREIEAAERLLSTWRRGGPLDRLDHAPAGQEVEIGRELAGLLDEVFALSRATDGAFDPTVLPLVRAWDLRGAGRIPSEEELARALAATGAARFRWDSARGTAARLSAEAGVDEGAWGKGYGLDRAVAALAARGVRRATLDLGGQVSVLDESWIPLADPRDRARPVAEVRVRAASLSTSGDSERSVAPGGTRVGHLLDPATGRPAPDFGSATVLAPSGLVADALSTALFVAGPRRGLALSQRLRRAGIAHQVLYLVSESGGRLSAAASPGLEYRFHPED
jgi:thiamine biosynthesis lipoprotein